MFGVKQLAYIRDGMIHLDSVNEAHPRISLLQEDIAVMHYVVGIAKSALWQPSE
jgi:phage repressor protein C with HTH and peptisase S24 domain